jgi:hypothetical protein
VLVIEGKNRTAAKAGLSMIFTTPGVLNSYLAKKKRADQSFGGTNSGGPTAGRNITDD